MVGDESADPAFGFDLAEPGDVVLAGAFAGHQVVHEARALAFAVPRPRHRDERVLCLPVAQYRGEIERYTHDACVSLSISGDLPTPLFDSASQAGRPR